MPFARSAHARRVAVEVRTGRPRGAWTRGPPGALCHRVAAAGSAQIGLDDGPERLGHEVVAHAGDRLIVRARHLLRQGTGRGLQWRWTLFSRKDQGLRPD